MQNPFFAMPQNDTLHIWLNLGRILHLVQILFVSEVDVKGSNLVPDAKLRQNIYSPYQYSNCILDFGKIKLELIILLHADFNGLVLHSTTP